MTFEQILEAERRGELSFQQQAALDELRRRGVIPEATPVEAVAAPQQRTGVLAAVGRGAESLVGTSTTGIQAITGDANEAAELALKRAAVSPYAEQVSWDKVKEVYGTQGALAAAMEVARQVPLAIAEQLPQLAASAGATAAGAKLGALTSPVTGPFGPIIGGGLGFAASTYPSLLGSDIERQAAVQRAAGRPIDIDMGAAALAATAQTGLEAAGTLIPLGRRAIGALFGPEVKALLDQGKKEAAEALARESLPVVLAKGTAVGVAAEVPTEILQSAIERYQAGLDILSDDALSEYGSAAYQAALVSPIGAAGRVADRSGARAGIEAEKQAQAAREQKAQRDAQEAEKQSPQYLENKYNAYQELLKRKNALEAQRKKGSKEKPLTQDEKDFNVILDKELAPLKADTESAKQDFLALGGPQAMAKLREQQRVAGITPQDYMLERMGVTVPAPTGPATLEEAALQREEEGPQESSARAYAAEQIAFAKRQGVTQALTPAEQIQLNADFLLNSIPTARQLLQTRTRIDDVTRNKTLTTEEKNKLLKELRFALQNEEPLPGLSKLESNAVLKLVKEGVQRYDQTRAERLQGSPAAQLEAEESAAVEEAQGAEAARLAEVEKRRKLSGEMSALQRMGASPRTMIARARTRIETALRNPKLSAAQREALVAERDRLADVEERLLAGQEDPRIDAIIENALRNAERKAPETKEPSSAIGQIQQILTGEDVTYTAEPPKERVLRRAPTEGLTLFGESQREAEAAPAKTPDARLLRERIARLLLNPNLSEEAYTLLRRAEEVMPDVETRIETVRKSQGPEGTQQDVAQTAGLLELLDQQLTRIERGEEGVPTAGRTIVKESTRPALGADVVAPSEATKDDLRLRRQATYANLVAQGFSPGAAAKRAFQIGAPTREAQEVPLDRTTTEMGPSRPEDAVQVTRKVPGKITPMEPREPRQLAPGPEAAKQPGRFLAQEPRKGTLRGRGAPLSLAAEIEPLLNLQERVRAEDAGQQVLFPELERERGTIAATPEAFKRRIDRLKAVKDGYARELLRKEAAVQPLEQEIRELEATLNEYQQQQKALQDAQFVLRHNELLLKELRVTGAGTEKLSGGIGALTVSENTFQQAADALNRQRVLLLNYAEQRRREREAAPKLKTKDFAEIGKLLAVQASDDARLANALASIEAEVERINAFEKDVYKQFPRIERAKEAARERMRDLHRRYGTASEFLDGLKTLRGKIAKQLETAKDSYSKDQYNEELRELVFELFQQTRDIDARIDRNKKLMSKISAQVDVAVAEANINRLKAEAPAGAVKKAEDALADAKRRLQTLRSDLAKTAPQPIASPIAEREAPPSAIAEGPLQEVISYSANLQRHQRMLEAMQLRTESGTIVPALSYAQRLARQSGAEVRFSVDDLALLDKDPKRVLNGLVSRATDLENKIKKAVSNSRGAVLRGEAELINRYKQLVQDYENADSSLERSQIEPELDLAAKEYNAALNESLKQRVVWKGQNRDTAELLDVYKKIAYLEERFFLPQAAEKVTYSPETAEEIEAREREVAEIFESQREAQAGAGVTSGEALTRSQVAKRRKAQKTVFSGKGIGPKGLTEKQSEDLMAAITKRADRKALTERDEELLAEHDKNNARLVESAKQYATAQELAILRTALEKRDRLESLTDLEQFAYNSAVEANRPSIVDFAPIETLLEEEGKGGKRRGAALSEDTALKLETVQTIEEGREDDADVEQNLAYTDSGATETEIEELGVQKEKKKSIGRGLSAQEQKKANEVAQLFKDIKAAEAELRTKLETAQKEGTLTQAQTVTGGRTTPYQEGLKLRKKIEEMRAKLLQLSRGITVNPSTVDSVRAELKKAFPDLGRVQIYDSVDALIKTNPQYEGRIPDNARGFVDSAGNKAFLIAENIDQGRALGVLLHEVGAHIGLKNVLGDAQYNALVKAVETWAKKDDGSVESRVAKAAQARVEAAKTPASQRRDETLAYAIEEAVNAGVKPMETKGPLGQWLGRIAQLFRRALEKFGLPPKALDAQGLVDMAFGAAKVEMTPAVPQMSRRTFLRGASAALGALKLPPLSKDMQVSALKAAFKASRSGYAAWANTLSAAAKTKATKTLIDDFADDFLLADKAQTPALRRWLQLEEVDGIVDYDLQLEELLSRKDGVEIVADLQQALQAQRAALVDAVQKTAKEKGLPEVGELFFSKATKYAPSLSEAGKVADKLIAPQRSFMGKLKANLLGFRVQAIDRLDPFVKAFERGVSAGLLSDLKATQAMYYLRMQGQQMHFTSAALSNGAPMLVEKQRKDGETEYVIESKADGANIKKIVLDILSRKEVAKEAGSPDAANRLLTLYMGAIRAENKGFDKLNFGRAAAERELVQLRNELKSETLKPNERARVTRRIEKLTANMDRLPSEQEIRAAKAAVEANPTLKKAFDEARDIYNAYNRDLISFAAETGTIAKDEAARLLRDNDYIPYYRERGGVAELVIGSETPMRIGNLKDNPHLVELMGDQEPIFDFLTSSVQNTSMLIDMSMHNLAVKNAMWELASAGLARNYRVQTEKGKRRDIPEGAVRFRFKGEDWYSAVDTDTIGVPSELLVKGLAGIPTMFPFMVQVLGMPARLLRRLIVASPIYAARQLFRDSLAASIASGANTVPVLSALKQIRRKSALDARGVAGGQVFTGMPEDMTRLLREMQSGRPGWAKAFSKLEAMSMEADAATRRAQYDSYIEQGLSEMEATYMSLESMNFTKRGVSPTIHMLSTLIPFFNAQIQGLDVLYKSFTGKMPFNERLKVREKLIKRGALMFGMSLVYAAAMQDEEEYKNATPDQKYGNWFVRMPFLDEMAGERVTVRVPIPFELGYIFKALPEALYNTLASEEGGKEALQALNRILINTVPGGSSMPTFDLAGADVPAPFPIPSAIKPLIELSLGKSFFTGRDLETAREQDVQPFARYREQTSEAAKAVGSMFNVSPIKLEALISGYTGSLGLALLQTLNFAVPDTGPESATKRLSQLSLVGTLFQPSDAQGIIDAAYARMNEVRQVQQTYEALLKESPERAAKYAQDKINEMALASAEGNFRQQLGKLTTYERQVRAAPTLTAQEKRERLDQLRQAKIRVAAQARALLDRRAPQAAPA